MPSRRPRFAPKFVAVLASLIGSTALAQGVGMGRVEDFYPTGERQTSIISFERLAPLDIRAGGEFEYTLIIRNLTGSPISNVVLTEEAAEGVRIVSSKPEPQVRGGGECSWNFETLEPRGTQQVSVRAIAERVGDITACAKISVQAATCARLRVVQPQIAIKLQAPPEVLQCDAIPLKLSVSNPGTGSATNVVVKHTLPENWSSDGGKREFVINVGELAAGQSREYTINARATDGGSVENCASAEAAGGLSAKDCAGTRVLKPELQLAAEAPSQRFLGRPAKVDLVLRNRGDGPARDVQLTQVLGAGLRFENASDGGKFSGGQISWNLSTLNPGEQRSVSYSVVADKIGAVRCAATAKAPCAEASTDVNLEIRGMAALLLEVVDQVDPVEVGANEVYDIRVRNQGTAPATNVKIECVLAKEQTFVSAEGPAKFTSNEQSLTFVPIASLAPGQEAIFKVVVKANHEGDLRFQVKLTSDQLKTPVVENESTTCY